MRPYITHEPVIISIQFRLRVHSDRKRYAKNGGGGRVVFPYSFISLLLQFPEILRRLQGCYKFCARVWFLTDKKKKKKEITNIRSLWRERFPNIYLFARQEKMNLNFPCFYVETEEQRNNNDSQNHCFRFTFTRRGESQEEIVKFYKEVNNRQDSRRSVDAANCNYARRSLKRGWEREEHDTRGQREREYDLHRWTVWFLRYPLSLDGEFAPPRTTA